MDTNCGQSVVARRAMLHHVKAEIAAMKSEKLRHQSLILDHDYAPTSDGVIRAFARGGFG